MNAPILMACPACGGGAFDPLGKVDAHAQHLAYCAQDSSRAQALDERFGHATAGYALRRCRDCGLGYCEPPLAPSSAWYGALYAASDLYPAARWEYQVVAQQLRRHDVLIDYGCGSGHFLHSVRDRVRRAVGYDFSSEGVAGARELGLDVRVLPAAAAQLDLGSADRADHMVAFHVLEHLAQPGALFEFARAVGHDATRLWVAVPSDRRASRVYGEVDVLDLPPHHLTRWTPDALRRIGHANGWALCDFRYEPLGTGMRVWEATRRLALYERLSPPWRPLRWLLRRLLAAAVWLSPRHRMRTGSGFSMLACYTPTPTK